MYTYMCVYSYKILAFSIILLFINNKCSHICTIVLLLLKNIQKGLKVLFA